MGCDCINSLSLPFCLLYFCFIEEQNYGKEIIEFVIAVLFVD